MSNVWQSKEVDDKIAEFIAGVKTLSYANKYYNWETATLDIYEQVTKCLKKLLTINKSNDEEDDIEETWGNLQHICMGFNVDQLGSDEDIIADRIYHTNCTEMKDEFEGLIESLLKICQTTPASLL